MLCISRDLFVMYLAWLTCNEPRIIYARLRVMYLTWLPYLYLAWITCNLSHVIYMQCSNTRDLHVMYHTCLPVMYHTWLTCNLSHVIYSVPVMYDAWFTYNLSHVIYLQNITRGDLHVMYHYFTCVSIIDTQVSVQHICCRLHGI